MIDLNDLKEAMLETTRLYDQALSGWENAVSTLSKEARNVSLLKTQLDQEESYHLVNGVSGKNAEERKANLYALTDDTRFNLATAERDLAQTQLEVRMYENRMQLHREILRTYRTIVESASE